MRVLNKGGVIDLKFLRIEKGLNEVSSELFAKAMKFKVGNTFYFKALVDSGRLVIKGEPKKVEETPKQEAKLEIEEAPKKVTKEKVTKKKTTKKKVSKKKVTKKKEIE